MQALAVAGNKVVELRRLAGSGCHAIAGVKGSLDEGTAQSTRGASDEPNLFHVP